MNQPTVCPVHLPDSCCLSWNPKSIEARSSALDKTCECLKVQSGHGPGVNCWSAAAGDSFVWSWQEFHLCSPWMRFALGMLWSCAFLSARAGNLSVEFLHSGHAADIVEQWQCQQPYNPTAGTQGNKERPRAAAIYLCRNSVLVQDNFSQCQDTATSLPRIVCISRHFCTKSFYSCCCLSPECDWKYLNCVWMRNSNKSLQTFFLQRVPDIH